MKVLFENLDREQLADLMQHTKYLGEKRTVLRDSESLVVAIASRRLKFLNMDVEIDTSIPADEIHFKDRSGRLVSKIINIGEGDG